MSTTIPDKATLPPYVKSLDEARAAALGCWPRDYCHRDDRQNSPNCDCAGCRRTMQRRELDRARIAWERKHGGNKGVIAYRAELQRHNNSKIRVHRRGKCHE
jgi:hypothetical protein